MKIAMRDLEIRGAGNLLGEAQSGNMEAVGYDLYCKMLNEAVRRHKGEEVEEDFDTEIDINLDAYIPSTYVANEFWKMDLYKRIAGMENEEDVEDMEEELTDCFGKVPKVVRMLLRVSLLRFKAHVCQLTAVKQEGRNVRLTFYKQAKIDPGRIPDFLQAYAGRIRFVTDGPALLVQLKNEGNKEEEMREIGEIIQSIERKLLIDSYE